MDRVSIESDSDVVVIANDFDEVMYYVESYIRKKFELTGYSFNIKSYINMSYHDMKSLMKDPKNWQVTDIEPGVIFMGGDFNKTLKHL